MAETAVRRPLLRRQLLAGLLAPLFLLLAADTFISYRVALDFSQRAHDRTLAGIAREVGLHLRGGDGGLRFEMPPEARRVLLADPDDRLFFEVAGADGGRIDGEPLPPAAGGAAVKRRNAQAFYDGEVHGEAVRIVELRIDAAGRRGAVVRVAETLNKRGELAHEILLGVVLPQLLLILIAGVVVWVGV
ncbi:MAG: sensor histidine kinase N-terminal domain-containing protein, partial [Burkholderiales bacterium]|nr:sensor histidine kinase N-terminal domain-containing protein [Burkholderiales bacterium]